MMHPEALKEIHGTEQVTEPAVLLCTCDSDGDRSTRRDLIELRSRERYGQVER